MTCITSINIIPNNNEVVLNTVNNLITVTDNNCCTTVTVVQPTTETIQILTGPQGMQGIQGPQGPQGPQGGLPTSGSWNFSGSIAITGSALYNGYELINTNVFNNFTQSYNANSSSFSASIASLTSATSSYLPFSGGTMTGPVSLPTSIYPTSSATQSIDMSIASNFEITLTQNTLFTFANFINGLQSTIVIKQDATGSWIPTFPSLYWSEGTIPTQTTVSNSIDIYTFIKINNNVYGSSIQNFLI
jgi:hypothetical protein